jgi:predicted deacylase
MQMPPKGASTAFTNIDYDGTGRQIGFIMLPHSPHEDAWGVTRVPVAVIANGKGPTVIIEGGNHGDEYEGSITIGEMIREIDPSTIQGRLILLPTVNVHAASAGHRTSPVDGLNFNRTFPGDALGTITQQIASYLNDMLFPMADAFMDLHSGGSSLDIIPSAIIDPADDPELHRKNIAAALAFGAPQAVVVPTLGDPRTATAAAVRAGLIAVSTEMAGGGTVRPHALEICRRGVRNVLAHLGVLPPEQATQPSDSQLLELPGAEAYVFATADGIFEPFHALGDAVSRGAAAGRIHCTWEPARVPETVNYGADGVLFGLRQPGRVRPGNCCAVVASPYAEMLR